MACVGRDLMPNGLINQFKLMPLLLFLVLTSCTNKSSVLDPNRTEPVTPKFNASMHEGKPIVLMISIDGFRSDYLEKYKPPVLSRMAKSGVLAESMIPGFPTLTFPNHISLVTGNYPGTHGIVSNKFFNKQTQLFYDPFDSTVGVPNPTSWYLTPTLWTVAEQKELLTGIHFWVGAEDKIKGVDPTYFRGYKKDVPNSKRVDEVISWMNFNPKQRPHLIGLYFEAVDTAGHKFGPNSEEVRKAIMEIDSEIGRLREFITSSKLDVNVIVVSDHGMSTIDKSKPIDLSQIADISKFKVGDRGPVVNLYSQDPDLVNKTYLNLKASEGDMFKVYLREDVPQRLHYAHNNVVGDIVVIAEMPYYIYPKLLDGGKLTSSMATHGWDPINPEMHAFFVAEGPQFRQGLVISSFENIHIFPLVAQILDLPVPKTVEGRYEVLAPILR